jgi:CBS domain-containing protein
MSCATIMTPDPVTLKESDSVAAAAAILLDRRFIILPVVDAHGRYKGQFGVFDLLRLMLPKAATLAEQDDLHIGFIADTVEDMRREFASLQGKRVREHVRKDLPVLRPDTPLMECLRLLYRSRCPLPVVDESTGRVVGVVSYWDAVKAVAGDGP